MCWTDLASLHDKITDHLEKDGAMGLIQVVKNETFDTVSHRKFLWKIKKVEMNIRREGYMETARTVIRVERERYYK